MGAEAAAPHALVLCGSPRGAGRCARLAEALCDELAARGARPTCWKLSERPIAPCTGCGSCSTTGSCVQHDEAWQQLEGLLCGADAVFVVAPLYFAGAPAQLKAALDRCQVFWARRYVLGQAMPPARPAHVLIVGESEGGGHFGASPLVTELTSALNNCNARITPATTHDFTAHAYDLGRIGPLVEQALAACTARAGEGA